MSTAIGIHHDGSELYVGNTNPKLGESVTVYLRVSKEFQPDIVLLRSVRDGEPVSVPAKKVARTHISGSDDWYAADLVVHNPRTNYRWLVSGGNVGYGWINQMGWVDHDTNDSSDFALTAFDPIARWAKSAVFYQIFPDRFAKSDHSYEIPSWAIPRTWDQWPKGRGPETAFEYFGGDFWGVIEHLDDIVELGVNALYFTPFFPAGSLHRYDASNFDCVDPLLGGDEALIALVEAAHARGLKVIGDITLNHSGDKHEWFLSAQAGDPSTRDFYIFNDELEHGYESWIGVKSLPKFNYASEKFRETMISGENSVLRKWLKPPFNLDGWRVDVANMSGRLGVLDMTHDVARLARAAVLAEGADKILIGEHNHDAGGDLDGDGWQGNMNYTSFRNPVCSWLVAPQHVNVSIADWAKAPFGIMPSITAEKMLEVSHSFSSRMPWQSYSASWNLLSSHDSPRIRSIVGSTDRQIAAATLAFTMPGSVMLFAGDEIGSEGLWGEDSRSPYPWTDQSTWDLDVLATYKQLIALRTSSAALAHGGLRLVHVSDDVIAYLREDATERYLVVAARDSADRIDLDAKWLEISAIEPLVGFSAVLSGASLSIEIPSAGSGIWRVS